VVVSERKSRCPVHIRPSSKPIDDYTQASSAARSDPRLRPHVLKVFPATINGSGRRRRLAVSG